VPGERIGSKVAWLGGGKETLEGLTMGEREKVLKSVRVGSKGGGRKGSKGRGEEVEGGRERGKTGVKRQKCPGEAWGLGGENDMMTPKP